MPSIDPYIEVLIFGALENAAWPSGYVRLDDLIAPLRDLAIGGASYHGLRGGFDADKAAKNALNFLRTAGAGAIAEVQDDFAGSYFVVDPKNSKRLADQYLAQSPIQAKANAIGSRFFDDVFRAYAQEYADLDVEAEDEAMALVPAADRVVTITHNQYQEIAPSVDQLISDLEQDNGVPDEPGFRERVLGKLRAGRELLRAMVFEAETFRLTMLVGLQMLAERYKEHAIGALASQLIGLLAAQLGLSVQN